MPMPPSFGWRFIRTYPLFKQTDTHTHTHTRTHTQRPLRMLPIGCNWLFDPLPVHIVQMYSVKKWEAVMGGAVNVWNKERE